MADETEIPDELIVTFRKPIEFGGDSYTQMKLQEPTAAQVQQWDKLSGTDADIMALTTVSGLPKPVIERLKLRDLNAGSRYIARFFE